MLFEDEGIDSKGLQAQERLCALLQPTFVAFGIDLDRIEENMMKKNLKRKHGSSTSGTDSTTASDSEA